MQALSHDTTAAFMPNTPVKNPLHQAQGNDVERLKDIARDFESVFISEMVKPMFNGIKTDSWFGGGKGEEIFRGLMIQEYGKNIAEKDMTGIQTQVLAKLIEAQAQRTGHNQTTDTQEGTHR